MIQHEPGATVTVTATPTVTVTDTATPTANAQGQATQISADGVYVIGTDIAGGTWHTSGGQQCYEATLNSTNTNDIQDNNNFTGPDTVDVCAKAFDISGGCTWQRVGSLWGNGQRCPCSCSCSPGAPPARVTPRLPPTCPRVSVHDATVKACKAPRAWENGNSSQTFNNDPNGYAVVDNDAENTPMRRTCRRGSATWTTATPARLS